MFGSLSVKGAAKESRRAYRDISEKSTKKRKRAYRSIRGQEAVTSAGWRWAVQDSTETLLILVLGTS